MPRFERSPMIRLLILSVLLLLAGCDVAPWI